MTAALKRRYGRTDANLQEIVAYLRERECWVYVLPPDAGADLLVGISRWYGRARWELVEVKDGKKSPSAQKLTDHEIGVRAVLNEMGLEYNVVTSLEDAAKLLDG